MRPVTLHDLAKHCQVSTARVGAGGRGGDWVWGATGRRVQWGIEELGYHPNQLARGLKRQEGHAVGVVVSDLTNPFFTSIVRSLSHSLRDAGRTLSLCDSDHRHDLGEANLRMLLEGQIVGLVIIGDSVPEKALRAFVKRRANVPVIVIERDYQIQQVSCLLVDSEQGGYAATCHLAERGRRRIAMIAGPTTRPGTPTYRPATPLDGYRRALQDLRLAFHERPAVEGDFPYDDSS